MDVFEQWREADRRAAEAEAALASASLRTLIGNTFVNGPSPEEIVHARRLRARASELFESAMQESRSLTDPNSRLAPL